MADMTHEEYLEVVEKCKELLVSVKELDEVVTKNSEDLHTFSSDICCIVTTIKKDSQG